MTLSIVISFYLLLGGLSFLYHMIYSDILDKDESPLDVILFTATYLIIWYYCDLKRSSYHLKETDPLEQLQREMTK